MIESDFLVKDVHLKNKTKTALREDLSEVDIIFVAGGNTSYLLEQAQKCGFIDIVQDLVRQGVIYIGSSAGSLLACPTIEIDTIYDKGEFGKVLASYDGLHLVDFVVLPHADNPHYEHLLKEVYEQYGDRYNLLKLNDTQFIVVTDNTVQIIEV